MKIEQLLLCLIFFGLFVSCNSSSKETSTSNQSSSREFYEERIEFVSMNDTLIGYLSKPIGIDQFPVVVIIHSASHGNHDYLLYRHLKKTLASISIGVFSYDRRGTGESQGDFNSASLEDLANDALSAIDKLKKRPDVNQHKMGFYGISQGGWIAPIAYDLQPENISFMILVSSCGVSPSEQMIYSATTTLQMQGYADEDIQKAATARKIADQYYRGVIDWQNAQRELNKFKKERWFSEIYLPVTQDGNLPEDPTLAKWIHELDFDPRAYYEKIRVPIALFYGETDRWVPIEKSIDIWKESLSSAGNNNYSFFSIKRAGHMMILDEDRGPKEEVISPEYSEEIKNWLLQIVE